MSLLSPRRGFHHDSGLPSTRQRTWARKFAREKSLRPSSSGMLAKIERPSHQTAQRRPCCLFCSDTTVYSISCRPKESTFRPPSCKKREPTTLLKRAKRLWRTCRTRQRSNNPIKRGTRRIATRSECQHETSSTHRKNITPLCFTNWPTAPDTQSA